MRLPAKEVGVHSPSRVQIPPSPLPAPGFHWNPGVSCVPVPPARVRAPGSVRVWGYRTLRVAGVATFRRVSAGKSVLKGGWFIEGRECPTCLMGGRTIGRVRTLGVMWIARQRRQCSSCEASDTPPAARRGAAQAVARAAGYDSRWADYPRISHAIPLTLCHLTHSHRWNCNVCGSC